MALRVYRFDDTVLRSHVIAESEDDAIAIFDQVLGKEYRDDDECETEIFVIDGAEYLSIDEGLGTDVVNMTADEWIEYHDEPTFL